MADPWKRKEVIGTLLDRVFFSGFPSRVFVYGVASKGDDEIVYIGSTEQIIHARIRAHVSDARKNSSLPVHVWMREQDYSFKVVLLTECAAHDRVDVEKRFIEEFGPRLNLTDGGPGMSGHCFAGTMHAKRIASALRTGGNFSCEECGAEFWRKRREVALGNNRFCSRGCYQSWQRGQPKKGRAAA